MDFQEQIRLHNTLRKINIIKASGVLNDIKKGKKANIGEVRQWKDGKYKRTADGWEKIKDEKQSKNNKTDLKLSKNLKEAIKLITDDPEFAYDFDLGDDPKEVFKTVMKDEKLLKKVLDVLENDYEHDIEMEKKDNEDVSNLEKTLKEIKRVKKNLSKKTNDDLDLSKLDLSKKDDQNKVIKHYKDQPKKILEIAVKNGEINEEITDQIQHYFDEATSDGETQSGVFEGAFEFGDLFFSVKGNFDVIIKDFYDDPGDYWTPPSKGGETFVDEIWDVEVDDFYYDENDEVLTSEQFEKIKTFYDNNDDFREKIQDKIINKVVEQMKDYY